MASLEEKRRIAFGRSRPMPEGISGNTDLYNINAPSGFIPPIPGMPGSSVMVEQLPRELGQTFSASAPPAVSVPMLQQVAPKTGVAAVEGTGAAAIDAGQEYGSRIVENQRERGFLESLLGGDLGGFVQNFLKMAARPEFLRPGFEGEGISPLLMGMAEAQAGMRADEKAKEQRALKALKEQRELEAGRRRELREIESLELRRQEEARQVGEAERRRLNDIIKNAKLTEGQADRLRSTLRANPQIAEQIDKLDGTWLDGVLTFFRFKDTPKNKEVLDALVTETARIQAETGADTTTAALQAATKLSGKAPSAPASVTQNNNNVPASTQGMSFEERVKQRQGLR
jgi:hypothetical protein